MIRLIILCLIGFIFHACENDSTQNFSSYSDEKNIVLVDELVACASSYLLLGQDFPDNKTAVYYKTIPGQKNLKLWYSKSFSQDVSQYMEVTYEEQDLHENFMGQFICNEVNGAFIVSAENDTAIVYSKPIEILTNSSNTVIDVDISIDKSHVLEPKFTWPESTIDSESIYFHLIVNQENNTAVSGTYSYENSFEFYNLDNVVFNVTENENPTLIADTEYLIQIMDVSENNWVTKIRRELFTTE